MGHSESVLKHIVKKREAATSAQDSAPPNGASIESPFLMPGKNIHFRGFVGKGKKLKAVILNTTPSDKEEKNKGPHFQHLSLDEIRKLARAQKEQGQSTECFNRMIEQMRKQIAENDKKHEPQHPKKAKVAPSVSPEKECFTSSQGAPTVHMIFNGKAFNDRLNARGTYICLYVKSDKPTQALDEDTLREHIDHLVETVKPAFAQVMGHKFVLALPEKSNPERFAALLDEAKKKHGISALVIEKRLPPSHINEFSADNRPPKAPRASGDPQKMVNELRRHIITVKHQL